MKHLYKQGGDWKTDDWVAYTIKAFNNIEEAEAIDNGWHKSLDDALAIEAEFSRDDAHEKSLREQIKQLGGTPAGRSSVARLESQLKELKNDDTNEG